MTGKNYTEEFRRRAVDLYESTPGATLTAIAADLGIGRGTLQGWVREMGGRGRTRGGVNRSLVVVGAGSRAARVVRLEAENMALRAEQAKLAEERDILRAAAKYFAGETNW